MSLQTIKDVNSSDYSDNDGCPPPFDYSGEIDDHFNQWIFPPVQYNVNSENQSESMTPQTPMLRELDEDTGCRDKVNNARRCVALSDSCIRFRGRELFRCEDENPSIPFTQNTNFDRSMIASLTRESLKNAFRILNLSKDEIQFVNKARDRENRKINTGNSRSKEKKEIIKQKEEIEKMEDQKIQLKEEKSELEWEIKEYKRLSTNLRSF